jgi:hypothetical protein
VTVDPSEAFGLFYKNNSGPVFRALLAGTLNRAAAEDATAEAFARALAHWGHGRQPSQPEGLGASGRLESPLVFVAKVGSPLVGRPAGTVAATARTVVRP